MPKILEKQALIADLAAVKSMLDFKSDDDDPIGRMAYEERARFLEQQIASLDFRPTHSQAWHSYLAASPFTVLAP